MSAPIAGRAYRLCIVAVAVLLLVVIYGQLGSDRSPRAWLFATFYSLPLLLPLPGLIRRNRYTYRWATLCVLPYFVVGLTEAFANQAMRWWATALLGGAIFWFISLIAYLRASAPNADSSKG